MPPPETTQVAIAGGGPAGIVLGYLLTRCGIETLVLESQPDFDRDFRGDTLHAGVMEIFQDIGLADRILELPHHKIRKLTAGGADLIDFTWLKTDFPYVTMMAQSLFLDFLAQEAATFPSFQIIMDASVRELITDENTGRVTGLRYRKDGQLTDVQAGLVVACDGRASHLRKEAKLEPIPVTDLLEVLWFRLPRHDSDPEFGHRSGALTGGRLPFIILERADHYQIAAVIPPGTFSEIRKRGIAEFHETIRDAAPDFYDRAVTTLDDWKKVAFLHVEGSRLKKWHLPGLLLIGDAAHVMTPIGGVGINYAIWDAVETANVLVPVLKKSEPITDTLLSQIQRRREPATKRMQTIQRVAGRRILAIAKDDTRRFRIPPLLRLLLKIPGLRSVGPRIIALGGKRTPCQLHNYFDS
jgi:2-polyprenyl-6-methoxyphenol hydroxylase-like FAD-dependent oxidoreductase